MRASLVAACFVAVVATGCDAPRWQARCADGAREYAGIARWRPKPQDTMTRLTVDGVEMAFPVSRCTFEVVRK